MEARSGRCGIAVKGGTRTVVVLLLALGVLHMPAAVSRAWAERAFDIKPVVSVIETYDDNVTYSKHDPIPDVSTTLKGGIALTDAMKTGDFFLDANVAEQMFLHHSGFNNTAEDSTFHFKTDLSKYDTLKLSNVFQHVVDPRSFDAAFGRTAGRYYSYLNDASIDYRHYLTSQISLGLAYFNDVNLKQKVALSDYYQNKVGTDVSYDLDSATSFGLAYSYAKIKFKPGNSATINEVALKGRRYLTEQMFVDLQIGDDSIRDFLGNDLNHPMFKASLTTDIDKTTRQVFAVEKGYSVTSYTQEILNSWRLTSTLSKDLLPRLNGFFVFFYGSGKYLTSDTTESLLGVTGGLIYELTEHSKLSLTYSHTNDDSNTATIGYVKNDVMLGLHIEF